MDSVENVEMTDDKTFIDAESLRNISHLEQEHMNFGLKRTTKLLVIKLQKKYSMC